MAIEKARKAAYEKSLDTIIRYEEGCMSKREWLNIQFKKGATVEISTKPRIRYNRIKYNRLSWKEQDEYEKRCEEMVVCYNLHPEKNGRYLFEITKTEYDYFLTLK